MNALVLAAGKSTRISTAADGLPKPLIDIDGESILVRSLKWLASYDITNIWINLHYKPELIKETVGDGTSTGTKISYSTEDEILGTAGAVKKLEEEWNSDFLVVYGDNILGFDIKEMIKQHSESNAVATIAVFDWNNDPHSGIAGGRVIMDDENTISNFTEGDSDTSWVNAGVYILSPEICAIIPENKFCDFGKDIFPKLIQEGSLLKGYPINSYCLASDTPEALEKAKETIKAS